MGNRIIDWLLSGDRNNGDCICFAILGTFIGMWAYVAVSNAEFSKQDAIEHNAAIYHPQTGEFTWNDELTTGGVTR